MSAHTVSTLHLPVYTYVFSSLPNLKHFIVLSLQSFILQHLLPLNIISSSSVKVIYNSADFKETTKFGYSADYRFHNEETCGSRRISTQIGKLHFYTLL